MLNLLKMRCLGCRIACVLSRSINDSPDDWQVSPLPTMSLFGVSVEKGSFRVVVMPNERCPCLRICDQVRLLSDGVDVFVPLLSRIRLRNAARVRAQREATRKVV